MEENIYACMLAVEQERYTIRVAEREQKESGAAYGEKTKESESYGQVKKYGAYRQIHGNHSSMPYYTVDPGIFRHEQRGYETVPE